MTAVPVDVRVIVTKGAKKHPYPEFAPEVFQMLEKENINIILLAENKVATPKIIFDSRNITVEENCCCGEDLPYEAGVSHLLESHTHYHITVPKDEKKLCEMVYGTAQMAYYGSHSKIHVFSGATELTNDGVPFNHLPNAIMFSKIFYPGPLVKKDSKDSPRTPPAIGRRIRRNETGYSSSNFSPDYVDTSLSFSRREESGVSPPAMTEREDSGVGISLSGLSRPYSEPIDVLHRSGSSGSTMFRMAHDAKTSLSSGDLETSTGGPPKRENANVRLALAILIDCASRTETRRFCYQNDRRPVEWWMERQEIMEFFFYKLRKLFSLASKCTEKNFYHMSFENLNYFRREMKYLMQYQKSGLYTWLKLHGRCEKKYVLNKLIDPLQNFAQYGDSKSTAFFLSRLLTAVLIHHLGWVATVAPPEEINSSASEKSQDKRTPSYNPIWAQLSEIYGAIGRPYKVARTIIVGKALIRVNRVRQLLSYVIRCTQVRKRDFDADHKYIFDCAISDVPFVRAEKKSESFDDESNLQEAAAALSNNDVSTDEEWVKVESTLGKWMLDDNNAVVIDKKYQSDDIAATGHTDKFTTSSTDMKTSKTSAGTSTLYRPDLSSCHSDSETSTSASFEFDSDEGAMTRGVYHQRRRRRRRDTGQPDISSVEVSPCVTRRGSTIPSNELAYADTSKPLPGNKYDPTFKAEVIELPLLYQSGSYLKSNVAEGLFGDFKDKYSSLFVLHATSDDEGVKKNLKSDLKCAVHMPLGDRSIEEAVAIVANVDNFKIEVVSSKSPVKTKDQSEYQGEQVSMSPLVSLMVEKLIECSTFDSPELMINCVEYHLRKIYLQSHVLADFLLSFTHKTGDDKFLFSISHLKHQSNIDTYDIPLLFAVATTHTPKIADMFGYHSLD